MQLLVVLMQSEDVELTDDDGHPVEDSLEDDPMAFKFRGGCTLIIDPELGRIEYAITKRIKSDRRKLRQSRFLRERLGDEGHTAVRRFGLSRSSDLAGREASHEALASLHRSHEVEGSY